jgi:23S rRNA (cytosine1962-C5)-methyltransferase
MSPASPGLALLVAEPNADHALLDSGNGRKLERCGPYRFIRPEPQAMWAPASTDWTADGTFVGGPDEEGGGRWHLDPHLPAEWEIEVAGVRVFAMCTPFRHLGFFPDMAPHWAQLADVLQAPRPDGSAPSFLNLFGYSGVASLVAARAGAQVVHVDASRKAVDLARRNALLSNLGGAPIRWIVEDARSFVAREVRRGRAHDAIFLDPPKYGRGPRGETWQLEPDLAPLVADCARLLQPHGRLLVLTTYAIRLSALALGRMVEEHLGHLGGSIDCGEMALGEEATGRLLPTAIFCRWQANAGERPARPQP